VVPPGQKKKGKGGKRRQAFITSPGKEGEKASRRGKKGRTLEKGEKG